jgi:hypothetical protein
VRPASFIHGVWRGELSAYVVERALEQLPHVGEVREVALVQGLDELTERELADVLEGDRHDQVPVGTGGLHHLDHLLGRVEDRPVNGRIELIGELVQDELPDVVVVAKDLQRAGFRLEPIGDGPGCLGSGA